MLWLPKSVRYASVSTLQSNWAALTGSFRYQTDTWHIWAALRERGWTSVGVVQVHSYESHANVTELQHTSPPADKTVNFEVTYWTKCVFLLRLMEFMNFVHICFQIRASASKHHETSTVRNTVNVLIINVFW